MTRLVAMALLVAGCGRSADQFPVGGGGGEPPGGIGSVDAAPDSSGGSGMTITGRVCVIGDARSPQTCASSGASGLTVSLGTASTTTTDGAGNFTITKPAGTNLVWHVTGSADLMPSAIPFSTDDKLPVITTSLYQDMGAATSVNVGDGSAIIAQLTHGGAPVSGSTATVTPAPVGLVYYDGADAVTWQANQTGSFGVVWVPGMSPGTAQLDVTGGVTGTVSGIPVYAGTITFIVAEIP